MPTGSYIVKPTNAALHQAARHWPRRRDQMELRRQALKLRFWPQRTPLDPRGQGMLLDVDWSWIRALRRLNIGELRISDSIGGLQNVRLIFFVGPDVPDQVSIIWILAAFPKKSQDFTKGDLKVFEARRSIVMAREYGP